MAVDMDAMGDKIESKLIKAAIKWALKEVEEKPELQSVLCLHSGIAGGAGLIPFPGVDVCVIVPNLWTMYARLSARANIPIKENLLKAFAVGILTNIVIFIAAIKVAGFLAKFIPGVGTIAGMCIDTAFNFAATYTSGILFIAILSTFKEKLQGSKIEKYDVDKIIKQMFFDKNTIKDIFKSAKEKGKNVDFKKYKEEAQRIYDENKKSS